MVKIVWTDAAITDLKSIHSYIARDSKTHADRFINKLISKVDQLEIHPNSGRVVPEFNKDAIRELIEGSYRIIYTLAPDHISIIRIHHSSRLLRTI
ncbi:MAG TPA: type II toxin-antitoxin system RelE/ParE family toxin [Ohtaekwangia sp.]|uniref:type II toxin-antitoxin system RelE/ParE family toxin n=1 Tax=Ohtaekwangia sp. TaxID=2066019 RepID=UPI002F939D06